MRRCLEQFPFYNPGMKPNYDKQPFVRITSQTEDCDEGWTEVVHRLQGVRRDGGLIICIECYPGVFEDDIEKVLRDSFPAAQVLRTADCLKTASDIDRMLARDLPDDPVFGRSSSLEVIEFFDLEKLRKSSRRLLPSTLNFVLGTGAVLVALNWDVLVYADLARWEIQQRQRRGEIGNFGIENNGARASEKYRRAFFVDWRAADRLKKQLLPKLDFFLDTNHRDRPRMISGELFRHSLSLTAKRPFRVQPLFDSGPWGGQWMREVCGLPGDKPNYAWCFDCVPEENSLVFGFGYRRLELPAIDLVFTHPDKLLGNAVHARFGTEFPIRFDFLDTMGGGNLSLQVHPLTEYIQQHFGMHYTQDESYYLLDAGADACVYLGVKSGVDPDTVVRDLKRAQEGGSPFAAERYINVWPAKKHDHFLIPAGTIHCSGRNSMVLEISATPYIFTFKLWDWGRLGLDGRPRPIHLEHGIRNIQWDRTTSWVQRELINQVETIAEGEGWREERTGLHEREFIETRRHWFTGPVRHETGGGVNVLNLVAGDEVMVESPSGAFEPMVVHYAETFIVPAAVGDYSVRPAAKASEPHATVKAFVRTRA